MRLVAVVERELAAGLDGVARPAVRLVDLGCGIAKRHAPAGGTAALVAELLDLDNTAILVEKELIVQRTALVNPGHLAFGRRSGRCTAAATHRRSAGQSAGQPAAQVFSKSPTAGNTHAAAHAAHSTRQAHHPAGHHAAHAAAAA